MIMAKTTTSTVPNSNETEYPVEIFGSLPAGFELRNQSVHLLAHWHGKTLKAIGKFAGADDLNQDELNAFRRIARNLFEALMAAETPSAGEVAKQLTAAVEMAKADETYMIEDILDLDHLRRLADNLTKATAAPQMTEACRRPSSRTEANAVRIAPPLSCLPYWRALYGSAWSSTATPIMQNSLCRS